MFAMALTYVYPETVVQRIHFTIFYPCHAILKIRETFKQTIEAKNITI